MELLNKLFTCYKSNRSGLVVIFVIFLFLFSPTLAAAGPFGYGGGYERYPGIQKDDLLFVGWATGWEDYTVGLNVKELFQTPEKALGKAVGTADDIVTLGRGGSITLTFDPPIQNGKGWDFAVFENAFNDAFLELAYVEVSSDGVHFIRFDNCSLTPEPVNAFGEIEPTDITGLAGKYRLGVGTPFDLQDLADREDIEADLVKLDRITCVKIIDIIGDRTYIDNRPPALITCFGENAPIYDPYPVTGSAGFDLEAIGVRYQNTDLEGSSMPPTQPILSFPENNEANVPRTLTLTIEFLPDPDAQIIQRTKWQISSDPNFSHLVFESTSALHLTSLTISGSLLEYGTRYYWRVKFYNTSNAESAYSKPSSFTTLNLAVDSDPNNGIPDEQEFKEGNLADLNKDGTPDRDQISSRFKCLNTVTGEGKMAIESLSEKCSIFWCESIDPNTIPESYAKPVHTPLGLFANRLSVDTLGNSAGLTLYLSEPLPSEARWYFYDPIIGWLDYSSHPAFSYGEAGVTFEEGRESLTLQLQDGGPGDADRVVNGFIITLGGLGYSPSPDLPEDGESGFGGLGNCFISGLRNDKKNPALK